MDLKMCFDVSEPVALSESRAQAIWTSEWKGKYGPQNMYFRDDGFLTCGLRMSSTISSLGFCRCEEGKTIPVGKTWTSEQGTSEWMVKSTQQSFQVCSEQGSQS